MRGYKLQSRLFVPKILIVEDEVSLAEVCRAILNQAGAHAHVIYDGADASAAIESFKPDVILSDVKMPDMRGDELLLNLLADAPHIPTILMSGLQRSGITIPRDVPNLFSLIYKPLEFDQLIRTVQSAVNLVEAEHLKRMLMQELHAQSNQAEDFSLWHEKAMSHLIDTWNKRRA